MITVGSRVGGYTVLQELGQGGMGRVYLAQHHRIERRAAIKVLLPELSSNAAVVERFFTEARATSSIQHPGIVEVLDCDVVDGHAFIVMEYLEGESLASYLRRILGLASDRVFALAVVGQVAQAVAAAHARGIVHRDLKPDNVFLCASAADRRVVTKVLDFGIAKLAQQRDAVHTRSGAIMGTPAYMSPEQCRGGTRIVDARSDVYALGCILYETLCGRRPFVREGLGDMILAHVSEAPEPLLALVPELPPMLDTLTMRMLAKDPRARPQSMVDVSTEIIECLQKLGVDTPIADIRPIERVILQARGRTPAPGVGSQATPRPPTAGPDGSQGSVPQSASQMGSGGTRLLLSGVDAAALDADAAAGFNAPDDYAPMPTTFRETAGESMRRAVASPRVRLAVLLGVAAIGGGGAAATFMSRGPRYTLDAVDDGPPTFNFAAGESRGTLTSGTSRVSDRVTVDVRGIPLGAQIWLDGALTSGLLPLRIPRDERRHVLSLRASGYEERVVEIDARQDQVVAVVMGPAASASVKAEVEVRDVVRARQAPPARDRTAGPARKRPQKKADDKSDDPSDQSRDSDAITDI